MQYGSYLRLDFRRLTSDGRREVKIVKLSNPNENSVLILIKTKKRNETGKFTYATEKSIELFDTNPVEVTAKVAAMLEKETGEKLPVATALATTAALAKKK